MKTKKKKNSKKYKIQNVKKDKKTFFPLKPREF